MILNTVEAGEGPPLVLLHGLFGQARNFGAVQRRLSAERRVIAPDLRNHGASPHDPHVDYATMAADVAETLNALGVSRADIVGHSMGGKVAMTLALTAPERVARLVISDIAPVTYAPAFRAMAAAMQSVPAGAPRAAAGAALAGSVPDAGTLAFLLANRLPDGSGWRIGLDEIAAALPIIEAWTAPDGARFDGPTLFVSGERSDYIQREHRAPIRALFPAARFITVKGAGHWVHADNPDGFSAVLEAFLA
ncbi:alpha/beta fold hydrolase [Muricoccus radiodurans]|uniref:alpha/beta fold hydrolase n=1 Tax=Muricoccus radiodurans TaxID=2231721 RepID=UPI003CE9826F